MLSCCSAGATMKGAPVVLAPSGSGRVASADRHQRTDFRRWTRISLGCERFVCRSLFVLSFEDSSNRCAREEGRTPRTALRCARVPLQRRKRLAWLSFAVCSHLDRHLQSQLKSPDSLKIRLEIGPLIAQIIVYFLETCAHDHFWW